VCSVPATLTIPQGYPFLRDTPSGGDPRLTHTMPQQPPAMAATAAPTQRQDRQLKRESPATHLGLHFTRQRSTWMQAGPPNLPHRDITASDHTTQAPPGLSPHPHCQPPTQENPQIWKQQWAPQKEHSGLAIQPITAVGGITTTSQSLTGRASKGAGPALGLPVAKTHFPDSNSPTK
jgi:hypothetical protein